MHAYFHRKAKTLSIFSVAVQLKQQAASSFVSLYFACFYLQSAQLLSYICVKIVFSFGWGSRIQRDTAICKLFCVLVVIGFN